MGCVLGPASREGEAVGPPSCDSARVYLDVLMNPFPVYRTRPGAAPAPRSWWPQQPCPTAVTSQLGTEGLAGEASCPPLLVLLWSGLVPSPSLLPDTSTPVLATSLCLWGKPSCPSRCSPHSRCWGQLPGGRAQLLSLPATPGGLLRAPLAAGAGAEQMRDQGSRAGQPGRLPPALCSWPSAARAQTLGRKGCKTAREGKQRGWSVLGCSGESQSAAGSSPARAVCGRAMGCLQD